MKLITLVFLTLFVKMNAFTCWHGVNLAGLDFGQQNLPGTEGKDYIVPTNSEVDYFVGKGMNVFRLPFLWERLQPSLNGNLDQNYFNYIDGFVKYATGKGASVLLDVHNYARYRNQVIGSGVAFTAFADFWMRVSNVYKSNEKVIFGIMNEPNTMPTEQWLTAANAAIAAIRGTGATNLIAVPGNAWTGAWSWSQTWYGTANAVVMKGIVDSGNNYVIEVHQYMDSDHSGTSANCVSSTIGSQNLADFTTWARTNKVKAFLGEWAGGRTDTCYQAIQDITNFMDNNTDVYLGWTWWAGGPWWADYIYALDPNGSDRPQMQYLLPHLKPC